MEAKTPRERRGLRRARMQVEAVLGDPKVSTASKLCRGALSLISQVGQAQGNPLAVASALGSAVEIVAQALDVSDSRVSQFVRYHGLERFRSEIGPMLERSGFLRADELDLLVEDEHQSERLLGITSPRGVLAFVQRKGEHEAKLSHEIYQTPGSEMARAFFHEVIWGRVGADGVEVVLTDEGLGTRPALAPIASAGGEYLGSKDVVAFADEVERYRRLGLSRSVLLYGPPGTGKSTFLLSYAELTRSRLLLIGAGAFEDLMYGDVERLVQSLEPDVLLLDDLDKCDDTEGMHALLPLLKRRHPRMLLAVTCNEPRKLGESFLRPGRGGELLYFGPPSREERRELLEHYLSFADVESRAYGVDELVGAMSEELTHDWVRDIAEHAALYGSHEELLAYVQRSNERQRMAADCEGSGGRRKMSHREVEAMLGDEG